MNILGSAAVAIVTGAGRGLGKAFAEGLLTKNYKVVLCEININNGQKTEQEFNKKFGLGSTMFIKCDVSKDEDVKNVINKTMAIYGKINVLVNNAGILNETDWKHTLEINLTSLIGVTQQVLPILEKQNEKSVIVNISSAGGLFAMAGAPVYCASKYGVVGYSQSLSEMVNKNKIRVICLCPSFSNSDGFKNELSQNKTLSALNNVVQTLGIMDVSKVAGVFLKCLETENNNGGVVYINPLKTKYMHPPHLKDSKL